MKKFSLILGLLALVLGMSQCKKPNVPEYTGSAGDKVIQYMTVNATHGNSNSKVSYDENSISTHFGLNWDENDMMSIYRQNGEKCGDLAISEGFGTPSAKFESVDPIAVGQDEKFTLKYFAKKVEQNSSELGYAEASVFMNQTGAIGTNGATAEASVDGIVSRLVLKAENVGYREDGNYSAHMLVPYAVLKLDLSALGTADGNVVKIYKEEETEPIATVNGVTNAADKHYYVAVPATVGNDKIDYIFEGNEYFVRKKWKLEANTYYTKKGNTVGDPIVIERYTDIAPISDKVFTVAEGGRTVKIASGNLAYITRYAEGKKWQMFAEQYDYYGYAERNVAEDGTAPFNPTQVSHFYWQPQNREQYSYAETYSGLDYGDNPHASLGDIFFLNTSEGGSSGVIEGWRALTYNEFRYMLETRNASTINGIVNARYTITKVEDMTGVMIFPDAFSWPSDVEPVPTVFNRGCEDYEVSPYTFDDFEKLETEGVIFLPMGGSRNGNTINEIGSNESTVSLYFTATPHYITVTVQGKPQILAYDFQITHIIDDLLGNYYTVNFVGCLRSRYACKIRLVKDVR